MIAASQSSLDVTILKITVQYNQVIGYDTHGCPDPTQTPQDKSYVKLQYSITNSGDIDFTPPPGFFGWAACYTPAIFKFLHLNIQGGEDSSGTAVAIDLNQFATCVIDDSDSVDAATCMVPKTNDQQQRPQQTMVIYRKGGTYGSSMIVYAKFALTPVQYTALSNSESNLLTFTLSVNTDISPGTAGVVSGVDGSQLSGITWKTNGTYHDPIDIYTAPVCAQTM